MFDGIFSLYIEYTGIKSVFWQRSLTERRSCCLPCFTHASLLVCRRWCGASSCRSRAVTLTAWRACWC